MVLDGIFDGNNPEIITPQNQYVNHAIELSIWKTN